MVFGPPIAIGKLERYLQPGESVRLTARPTMGGILTKPALILSILSVVIFGVGTLVTTIAVNAAANLSAATVDSVLAGFRIAEVSFFIAWVVGIVGTCLWSHVGRGARAGLAVLVAIGTPIVWFVGVIATLSTINPNNINTPAQAASAINGVLWVAFGEAVAVLIVFALLIPLLITVLRAGRSDYALTDRRVLKVTGSTPRDAPLASVIEVTLSGGTGGQAGTLVFATAPTGGASPFKVEPRNQGIVWFGVPRAEAVRQAALEMLQTARPPVPPIPPPPQVPPPP